MLHLRVISPNALSDDVLAVLRGNQGVTHVVVHRDAAIEPVGDEITADIARESANSVVGELKGLGVKERGAITLEVLDTVLSTRAWRAEEKAEGEPADAVIWDELVGRTREESTLTVTFVMFLCIACLIAAVGVVTDSPVTIVGAMVVGPEFGPLAGLAVALVNRRLQPRASCRTGVADRLSDRHGHHGGLHAFHRSRRLGDAGNDERTQ